MREFSIAAIACVVVLSESCCRCDAIIQSRARLGIDAPRQARVQPPGSLSSAPTGARLQRLEPLAQSNDLTLENNDYTRREQ